MDYDTSINFINSKGISAYEIHKATGLNEAGVRRVLKGLVSNPQRKTKEALIDYAIQLKSTDTNTINKPIAPYNIEGKIINDNKLPKKKVHIVPIKGRGGLENAYYDVLAINELEVEDLTIKKESSKGSKWFKIEVEGVSMDDSTEDFEGSKYSLCEGDWAYVRSVPKIHWRNKLHFNSVKAFCFFHNVRGILFKKVKSHNTENGF